MTSATFIRANATAAHRAAARELARFLAVFDQDAIRRLVDALRGNLRSREAVTVAIAAIMAVDPHDRPELLDVVLQLMPPPPAGWPDAPFLLDDETLIGDAALWAETAWPQELVAYALAILAKLPVHVRAALLRALDEMPAR